MEYLKLIQFNHKYTKKSWYLWLIYDIIIIILLAILILLLMPWVLSGIWALILIGSILAIFIVEIFYKQLPDPHVYYKKEKTTD